MAVVRLASLKRLSQGFEEYNATSVIMISILSSSELSMASLIRCYMEKLPFMFSWVILHTVVYSLMSTAGFFIVLLWAVHIPSYCLSDCQNDTPWAIEIIYHSFFLLLYFTYKNSRTSFFHTIPA